MTFKPLIVQADPVWQGKHPYHDSRFITTNHQLEAVHPDPANGDPPTWRFTDSEGRFCDGSEAVIATMRDHEKQAEYAKLFAAAPELLEACKESLDHFSALDTDSFQHAHIGRSHLVHCINLLTAVLDKVESNHE